MRRFAILLSSLSILAASQTSVLSAQEVSDQEIQSSLNQLFTEEKGKVGNKFEYDALITPSAQVSEVQQVDGKIQITFNQSMAHRTWTPESVEELESLLVNHLTETMDVSAEDLELFIGYDQTERFDPKPIGVWTTSPEQVYERQQGVTDPVPALVQPVVKNSDYAGPDRSKGLANKNFAIAGSHGWTWHKENRWQFQRARLYTIIEDLFPQSYINPFLTPMLQNAGASVWSLRERSYQTAEVIVDNTPESEDQTFLTSGNWETVSGSGWKGGRPPVLLEKDEPFTWGDTLRSEVDRDAGSSAEFIPFIPRDGIYPVYMSWNRDGRNSASVPVTITHAGGETKFRVNQQVAGATWTYLGDFYFKKGNNPETGKVTVSTLGALFREGERTTVSVDAVRFGGGMGNIAVEDHISHHPRYAEGARYYAQYAGAPSEAITNRPTSFGHFGFDYNEDITSRGEFANYLMGTPNSPNGFENMTGLGIPLDAMVSWHTDAGGEEFGQIGTLMIWQLTDDQGDDTFPDGRSRWLNRDLSVYLMEEMVRTAREEYTSSWAKREHRERGFGETRRPNMPSALIELLSHHNPNDMKYGLDPRFKKDIARSVYKGLLKFVADSNGYDYVVQPLEPNWVEAKHVGNGVVEIKVEGQSDPLEPTAEPTGFVVYQSTDGLAFDNGTMFTGNSTQLENIPEDETTYFRVTAVNEGGESLPSPVVGVRWSSTDTNKVLIVDGFDRISGPAIIDNDKGLMGFDRNEDPGVGYHYNYGLVGNQHNFDFHSPWKNDLEDPGRGGSKSDMEDRLEMGNHFNHIIIHGESFAASGYSFDSMTRKAFADSDSYSTANLNEYVAIDWIAGEQKAVPPMYGFQSDEEGYPDRMETEFPIMTDDQIRVAEEYMKAANANLMISGSYFAEELIEGAAATDVSKTFAKRLGFQTYITDATTTNALIPSEESELPIARFGNDLQLPINIEQTVYPVEKATGFEDVEGQTLLLYGDSNIIAGYTNNRVAVFGFPLETVLLDDLRNTYFDAAINNIVRN